MRKSSAPGGGAPLADLSGSATRTPPRLTSTERPSLLYLHPDTAPAAPPLSQGYDHTNPQVGKVLPFREGGPIGQTPGEEPDRPTQD
jgi:hypothetical protein